MAEFETFTQWRIITDWGRRKIDEVPDDAQAKAKEILDAIAKSEYGRLKLDYTKNYRIWYDDEAGELRAEEIDRQSGSS